MTKRLFLNFFNADANNLVYGVVCERASHSKRRILLTNKTTLTFQDGILFRLGQRRFLRTS